MSEQPVTLPSGSELPIDVIGRASPEIVSTLSAAMSTTTGTSAPVTSGAPFPQSGNFVIRVDAEEMLVTAGWGTGAVTYTVSRGYNNTTAATHLIGASVAQVVGVQRVEPVPAKKMVSFKGRAATFQVPGLGGTSGEKLTSLFNTNAAPNVIVDVETVLCDLNSTVARTGAAPVLRLYKVTSAPTNGSPMTKVSEDSVLPGSSGNVALLQGASAEGTASASPLTAALTVGVNVISQVFPSQTYSVAAFAPFDPFRFFPGDEFFTLNPGEGIVVMLDTTVATQSPTTDRWTIDWRWTEYTNA